MVQHSVEDGGGDDRISENLIPLAEAAVRCEDQSSFFITAGDELKKQVVYNRVRNFDLKE